MQVDHTIWNVAYEDDSTAFLSVLRHTSACALASLRSLETKQCGSKRVWINLAEKREDGGGRSAIDRVSRLQRLEPIVVFWNSALFKRRERCCLLCSSRDIAVDLEVESLGKMSAEVSLHPRTSFIYALCPPLV